MVRFPLQSSDGVLDCSVEGSLFGTYVLAVLGTGQRPLKQFVRRFLASCARLTSLAATSGFPRLKRISATHKKVRVDVNLDRFDARSIADA